jgi:hypothetical protein
MDSSWGCGADAMAVGVLKHTDGADDMCRGGGGGLLMVQRGGEAEANSGVRQPAHV